MPDPVTNPADGAKPPTATYRLQLRGEFGFRDAAGIVPYLAQLGVSHVYCSPVLDAVPGSPHGYDVVDHRRLSTELGGDAGWADLVAACRASGLGLVVDVVPNHMAIPVPESRNAAFWDVLEHGRESAFAHWFDVDWEAEDGRILVPVLGGPVDSSLAAGEISVDRDVGVIRYYDHEFPLRPGTEELADDLAALLDAQHYRLSDWRAAATRLNYRRFFDVTSLIGVRVEQPDVFTATHERLLELIRSGQVTGLRIDHPDGLADPGGYLDRLADATGGVWTVVEKILESGEQLPRTWRTSGTTGYDAITAITHALLDPAGRDPMTSCYAELTGEKADYDTVVEESKRQVVETLFGAEVDRLTRDLDAVGEHTGADVDRDQARAAIVELLVAFDVYRAYAGDADSLAHIDAAAKRAATGNPAAAAEIRWIRTLLRRETATQTPAGEAFAVRFEQTTGPVMAKGVEDTAFYRYFRLAALNEVGGNPGMFGSSVEQWHEHCERLARDRPAAMTTLSTHDTKRSEDVRARLLVLAEIPDRWKDAVLEWRERADRHGAPDANTDYLFWQTLVSAWPLTVERMQDYMAKATHEAKRQTSWIDPDEEYDDMLRAYVTNVFADVDLTNDVARWSDDNVSGPGNVNALVQKVLQLTMPGIPDVFQGQEVIEPTLVDPDNRRPVDYGRRRAQLERHDRGDNDPVDGKLLVTTRTLRLRRERPAAFGSTYEPLAVSGAAADHAIAFLRGADVAVVVTRLPVGLQRRGGWKGARVALPAGEWVDVFTDRPATDDLEALMSDLPVALLTRTQG